MGEPEEGIDISKGCKWNDTELTNIKSVKESLDHIHAYTGLMAGFEGFIINEYANTRGQEEFSACSSRKFGHGIKHLR